jgi:hypothetical protein
LTEAFLPGVFADFAFGALAFCSASSALMKQSIFFFEYP